MFDLLLGDNLSGRKEYIAEHGVDYLELRIFPKAISPQL